MQYLCNYIRFSISNHKNQNLVIVSHNIGASQKPLMQSGTWYRVMLSDAGLWWRMLLTRDDYKFFTVVLLF